MVIDSIGVNAPVVPEGLTADDVPIMPLNAYDVAWYTFTAQPGTGGNAVFAGHVTWNGLAVFYYLNEVSPAIRCGWWATTVRRLCTPSPTRS